MTGVPLGHDALLFSCGGGGGRAGGAAGGIEAWPKTLGRHYKATDGRIIHLF